MNRKSIDRSLNVNINVNNTSHALIYITKKIISYLMIANILSFSPKEMLKFLGNFIFFIHLNRIVSISNLIFHGLEIFVTLEEKN